LPRHSARRLALLEKAGLVDHEDRIVIRQMLDDIIADDIAQGIRIPIPATQDRLLPPWARIACGLSAHPTGLALLISKQTFQKQASILRNTLLPEQWTYPLLDLPKRRRPQRKRLFNRRCLRPRCSNHGCPWIQKASQKATVMLRDTFDALQKGYHLRKYGNCHPVYVMALLRIADYLQLQRDRAPGGVLRVKGIRSPKSRREWAAHESVQNINYDQHDDPEVVEIIVNPTKTSIDTFLRLQSWLTDIQSELDATWAVLGEVYGRFNERDLGLTIRRIQSNLENKRSFGRTAGYIPESPSGDFRPDCIVF